MYFGPKCYLCEQAQPHELWEKSSNSRDNKGVPLRVASRACQNPNVGYLSGRELHRGIRVLFN